MIKREFEEGTLEYLKERFNLNGPEDIATFIIENHEYFSDLEVLLALNYSSALGAYKLLDSIVEALKAKPELAHRLKRKEDEESKT